MTFDQVIKDLKAGNYKPVYFLMGEEPYYIDVISDYIEEHVLSESERDFNQSILYGREIDLQTVISEAKRFPMMSKYQVVIVKEAQNIRELAGKDEEDEEGGGKKLKEKPKKEKVKSPLQSYIENPQTSTILVICYKYKSLNKNSVLAKTIDKHGVLFKSEKLYPNKVPDFINTFLKQKGYTIGPKAAALLTEYLGTDLSKIVNELEKLIISLPSNAEITTENIQRNIGISKDYNVFELQNALGQRDILKANRIINYFAANPKENPFVMVIATLFGYFSKLILYHFTVDKSRANIASVLKVNPFFVSDYENAAKNYGPKKLVEIISLIREFDLKSKGVDSGSASDGELMKELIYKILH